MSAMSGLGFIRVHSRALRAVAYDRAARTLVLEFVSGDVYQYLDVPTDTFEDLMAADSKGTYFQRNIRDQFRYRKLT
jgi:hypothetical protein